MKKNREDEDKQHMFEAMMAERFKTNGGRDNIKDLRKAEQELHNSKGFQVHNEKIVNATDDEQILKSRKALYEIREKEI